MLSQTITLTIATPDGETDIPDVDLNLTVREFQERHLNPSYSRSGTHNIARVAAELKNAQLCISGGPALDLNAPLRTLANLEEGIPLLLKVVVKGGH